MIEWTKHFNKLIYNFTSRGFTFLLLAAFAFLYSLFNFMGMPESEAVSKKFIFDNVNYAFLAAGFMFLGKTGFEKYLSSKNGN